MCLACTQIENAVTKEDHLQYVNAKLVSHGYLAASVLANMHLNKDAKCHDAGLKDNSVLSKPCNWSPQSMSSKQHPCC